MELELKHLAAYLPYGLKCFYLHKTLERVEIINKVFELGAIDLKDKRYMYWTHDRIFLKNTSLCGKGFSKLDFKPILRPLSDLTKEIEVNGQKFIPIVKLADKAGFLHGKDYKIVDYGFGFSDYGSWDFFRYDYENKNFYFDIGNNYDGSNDSRVVNSFELVNNLLEWHFDIYSLIPNNLAIDINKIK